MTTALGNDLTAFVNMARHSAAVQEIDDRIAGCHSRIAALNQRCEPLHQQVAELQQASPLDIGPDATHVAALMADPEQRPDIAAITETVSAARKDEDVRQLTIATLQAAISGFGNEIALIEQEIAALAVKRQAAWLKFAKVARDDLHRLFIERFGHLHALVMRPLDAIARLRDAEGRGLLSAKEGGATRFSRDTLVAVETWDLSGSAYYTEKLFDAGRSSSSQREVENAMTEFRAMLAVALAHEDAAQQAGQT
ncbi:hypothetical protein [Novosphingobium sp. LASN5T]|uniref:hypothetical protein n=1 Tax=Novosphingobium sp. LASN5T TaxID=2491021 RepID=UPI000F5E8E27|nr:hypothetical protein [Novosphingobium sp. LASN5T]RQW45309.1 hypothetical protein EH199_05315 [Novosphingobium sp. LASN5T]